jgi:DNA (cytosine-5)-methyltransferase 1
VPVPRKETRLSIREKVSAASAPAPVVAQAVFRFIDLCAGIGGMRIAAEGNGGACVFSSEINDAAQVTYEQNFGEVPHGDITKIDPVSIPDHDLLIAGFPCQPFSICGYKKGFADTRGTIFFHILEIARIKMPSCILLENVKHFSNHDGGNTKRVVISSLENLGYKVSVRVINAKDFGLAQNRERTIIVASLHGAFDFSTLEMAPQRRIADILEPNVEDGLLSEPHTILASEGWKAQPSSGLIFVGYRNRNLRKAGTREGTEHLSRVHKQPNRIYHSNGTHPTLAAGETSGRYWILHEGVVRKITIRECYRLQGFPDSFKIHSSQGAAYKQIGNSVPIPMIQAVISQILSQALVAR